MTEPVLPARSLVVSCQAQPGNPLQNPAAMVLMACAAEAGGAAAIRANGPQDVAAIRSVTSLPIIGIHKIGDPTGVSITPTYNEAAGVVRAGADLVALDGTSRLRPDGRSLTSLIGQIQQDLGVSVMADVDCLDAGLAARDAGADLVATTLSGYTTGGPAPGHPDLELVAALAEKLDCPVVAEGRYRTPEQVRAACEAGAHAVVVGYAITNPMDITARLVAAITGMPR